MPEQNEKIYDSPTSEPDDDFWLDHGKKILEDSITAVRDAAKSLMTGLGLLTSVYLAILGFANFLPRTLSWLHKGFFFLPLFFWLIALHCSLTVMMTKEYYINLHSPDDIRETSQAQLKAKQTSLQLAFWLLAAGLISALMLMVYRLKFGS